MAKALMTRDEILGIIYRPSMRYKWQMHKVAPVTIKAAAVTADIVKDIEKGRDEKVQWECWRCFIITEKRIKTKFSHTTPAVVMSARSWPWVSSCRMAPVVPPGWDSALWNAVLRLRDFFWCVLGGSWLWAFCSKMFIKSTRNWGLSFYCLNTLHLSLGFYGQQSRNYSFWMSRFLNCSSRLCVQRQQW